MAEDLDLLREYESEAMERIQAMEESLLVLADDPGSVPALNDLFRQAHTLKGNSGFIGFSGVVALCHGLEDALGNIRKTQRRLTTEEVASFFATVDAIKRETSANLDATKKAESGPEATDRGNDLAGDNSTGVVAAVLGQVLVGFPIECVREICLAPRISRVLHSKAWLRGLANVRGEIIPVVNTSVILGFACQKAGRFLVVVENHREMTGVEVDRLIGVRSAGRLDGAADGPLWRGKTGEGAITVISDVHRLCA